MGARQEKAGMCVTGMPQADAAVLNSAFVSREMAPGDAVAFVSDKYHRYATHTHTHTHK